MGELHLEIIRDRILKEYKIEADLGPLQIAYREMGLTKVTDSINVDVKIGSHKNSVLVKMSLIPNDEATTKDVLKFDKNPDSASCIAGIYHKHMQAIRHGVEVGLSRGPKVNCQVRIFTCLTCLIQKFADNQHASYVTLV